MHSTLWVVHSDGSGLRRLPIPQAFCGGPRADPDTRGCVTPAWSPDGHKVAFRRTTPGFGESGDLYTINADGTGLFQVAHGDVEDADWGTHPSRAADNGAGPPQSHGERPVVELSPQHGRRFRSRVNPTAEPRGDSAESSAADSG